MEVKKAVRKVEGKTVFAMSSSAVPVCRVDNHETVIFVTKDCFDNQFMEEGPAWTA